MLSSVKTGLRHLFSGKCDFCENCESYLKDSWYCNEDNGVNCGKAREAFVMLGKNRYPPDPYYVSVKVNFEEPQEALALLPSRGPRNFSRKEGVSRGFQGKKSKKLHKHI